MKIILFLGPAGSGKTTQAKLLADSLGLPFLSMGDLLYLESQGTGEDAKKIKEAMDKGDLVDNGLSLQMLEKHLKQGHERGVVMDGFPRELGQAKSFSLPVDKVVYLHVPDVIVKQRLLERGRADDTPEVIENRLKIYHEETEPVLEYYRQKGILREVDGTQSIDEVARSTAALFAND